MTVSRPLTQEMELYFGEDIELKTYLSARDLDRKEDKFSNFLKWLTLPVQALHLVLTSVAAFGWNHRPESME